MRYFFRLLVLLGEGIGHLPTQGGDPSRENAVFPLAAADGCRLVFSEPFSPCLNFKPNRGIGWRFAGFPVQGWDSSYPSREKPSSTCVMLMGLPAGRKA